MEFKYRIDYAIGFVPRPIRALIITGLTTLMLSSCSGVPQSTPTLVPPTPTPIPPIATIVPSTPQMNIDSGLEIKNPGFTAVIQNMFKIYVDKYGCGRDSLTVNEVPSEIRSDGAYYALTTDDNIGFTKEGLVDKATWADTASHEFTHACSVAKKLPVEKQFRLSQNMKVIEFMGFAIGVELSDGSEAFYVEIDEAAAEYLAKNLKPDYFEVGGKYKSYREMMFAIADKYFSSDPNKTATQIISELNQKSDLPEFIAHILNKKPEELTADDYNIVRNVFGYYADGKFSKEELLKELDKYRKPMSFWKPKFVNLPNSRRRAA